MDDLISRQAAIDAVGKYLKKDGDVITIADVVDAAVAIGMLPSAEPERKTGRWIKVNGKTAINCSACYHCSWSLSFEYTVKRFNYCPNCGADMRGGEDALN